MAQATSIIRISILLGITFAAIVLTFGIEQESPYWTLHFVLDKALGASLFYLAWRLFSRWLKTDRWLRIYKAWCMSADR